MPEQETLVKEYVYSRLKQWQREEERQVRADLANLRRGIGKKPGELPELWGLLFRDFPEELMSRNGEPTWAEWAVSGALTLYALHQQGMQQSAHAKGQSLGRAIRALASDDEQVKAVQRRFNAFATAKNMPECMQHLRGLVQLLHSKDVSLDYVELAEDLYVFQTPGGASGVRLRWGQDFYRTTGKKEEREGTQDE